MKLQHSQLRPVMGRYKLNVWDNAGRRTERYTDMLHVALMWAKEARTRANRTVKIGHDGDAIRHWTRTNGAHGNQWSAHSTAECSR
jgi:hypothetical protein